MNTALLDVALRHNQWFSQGATQEEQHREEDQDGLSWARLTCCERQRRSTHKDATHLRPSPIQIQSFAVSPPRASRHKRRKKRMERNPGRLIEQLQSVQARQRKVIQQLQAENGRRLNDLADVRQERDMFRKEAARVRKENVELQNRLEQMLTECQDLKRERATLARSMLTVGHPYGHNANLGLKVSSRSRTRRVSHNTC